MSDAVNHPRHYGGDTTYETIKVLEAWLSPDQFEGFLLGNAIKYLSRAGKKDAVDQDLAKGRWYLERHQKLISDRALDERKDEETTMSVARSIQHGGVSAMPLTQGVLISFRVRQGDLLERDPLFQRIEDAVQASGGGFA